MRRALIFCCLAAGCGIPDLDTPATRASVVAPYPELAPRAEILSRVMPDTTTGTIAELSQRSAGLSARGASVQGGIIDRAGILGRADALKARAQVGATDRTGILGRADALKARAQGVRDVETAGEASAAADLRQRAAAIRSGRGTAAAPPAPAEGDTDAAERLRRLRLLRDGTGDDPL